MAFLQQIDAEDEFEYRELDRFRREEQQYVSSLELMMAEFTEPLRRSTIVCETASVEVYKYLYIFMNSYKITLFKSSGRDGRRSLSRSDR